MGSAFSSPPMSFAVNGKQFVGIVSGMSEGSRVERLKNAPELKDQANANVLYVFALQ
jgi:hypothetical protein